MELHHEPGTDMPTHWNACMADVLNFCADTADRLEATGTASLSEILSAIKGVHTCHVAALVAFAVDLAMNAGWTPERLREEVLQHQASGTL